MISRRTALLLATHYSNCFRRVTDGYVCYDSLGMYDFLYAHNYPAWFMNAARAIRVNWPRNLADFIMRVHTGECLAAATPNWDWPQREKLGQEFLRDLAKDIFDEPLRGHGYNVQQNEKEREELRRLLELDGYVLRNGKLLYSEDTVLDTEEEEGIVARLIDKLKLDDAVTPKHHLRLSEQHYTAGLWDDCIGNARKVLESVLEQSAERYCQAVKKVPFPPAQKGRPVEIRKYLEHENLLESKEREALDKVYGALSNTGGHPYIADRDQARLMRHLALTFTQFVLLRVEGALTVAGVS